MKQAFLLSFILLSLAAFTQDKLFKSLLLAGGGYGKHGTGDLPGIVFYTEFDKAIGKRTEWAVNATTTIHGDEFGITIIEADGTRKDRSFRYTTAGLQLGPKFGYSFVQSRRHQFKIQGGGFVRYQNSSYPDIYSYHLETGNGVPQPQFEFWHSEKQNLFTAGYSLDLSYAFITPGKLMLGVKGGIQNDSNGDMIYHYGLFVGRRL